MSTKKTVPETVLITGAARGLGRALAHVFAANGHALLIHDRDRAPLAAVEKELKGYGVPVTFCVGDLVDKRTLDRLAAAAKRRGVTVLVNNAGLLCPHLALEQLTDTLIDTLIAVNLSAQIKLTRRIYTFFTHTGGTIITINSLSGKKRHYRRSLYCASKGGLRAFTETLRLEAPARVRLLDIYPGQIRTRPAYTDGMPPSVAALTIYAAFSRGAHSALITGARRNGKRRPR